MHASADLHGFQFETLRLRRHPAEFELDRRIQDLPAAAFPVRGRFHARAVPEQKGVRQSAEYFIVFIR